MTRRFVVYQMLLSFPFFYEHRPVGSSETRILIRGTCFADGRHVEIHWDISRSVVNATAGVLVHSMDKKYIEVGFLRRNVLNIGCSGLCISGCQWKTWLWGRWADATLSGQGLKLHGCFFVTSMLASDIDLMIWFCCCSALDVHRGWHLPTAHSLRTVHFALTQLYVVITTVDDAVYTLYI